MRLLLKIAVVAPLALPMTGCAYKELKAPCGPDEGRPLAYAETTQQKLPAPFDEMDSCGPMRWINKGPRNGGL